ncbi:MAG: tetratricopeptide repeat protein [Nitrospirae bacterium]|nr:tetratricopeptide repeat protein [Nitrospirota bacterium]
MPDIIVSKWGIGDKIRKRYEVLDIKAGGMGSVYICYDIEFRKKVALKTLQERFIDNASIKSRFMWEAETWVRLEKHPNIVHAYYVNEIEGRPFICLEYIEGNARFGADLKGWITNGALDFPACLDFAIQFCSGMLYASEKFKAMNRTFVYRDIKPSNIMVTEDRTIKITDFGLVKLAMEISGDKAEATNDFSLTRVGTIMGTPFYMSPEQWQNKDLDQRSDIYSFGCVLYEAITRRPPFITRDFDGLKDLHLKAAPPPITFIGQRMNNVILKCLQKDRTNRYSSFGELKAALIEIYTGFTGKTPKDTGHQTYHHAWELVNKGISLFNLRYFDEALNLFNEAITLRPGYAEAFRNRGSIYHALGKFDNAIEDYNAAIKQNPQYAEAYFNRGITYFAAAKAELAIKDFNKAVLIDPEHAESYYSRGVAHRKLGNNEQALSDYNEAISHKPGYVKAYQARGNLHYLMENFQDAANDYEAVLKLNPDNAECCFNLALACENLEQYSKALNIWMAYLRVSKDKPSQKDKIPLAHDHVEQLTKRIGH